MSNINTEGYGSPYMSIEYNKKPIPGVIVRWTLVDSEKKDDLLEFIIETEDPDLPDDPAFQENSELIISRGYIGGIQGASRKFYVRDVEPNYNEKNLSLAVKCTDKAALLKQTKAGSKKSFSNKTPKEIIDTIATAANLDLSFLKEYQSRTMPTFPTLQLFEQDRKVILQNLQNNEDPRVAKFRSQMNTNIKNFYAQGNKSDARAIREVVEESTDIPGVVTGHDDILYIYPRDLSGKPFRIFKWKADSDLLTFIPETKTRAARSADSHIQYTFTDEATKKVIIGQIDKRSSENVALNDTIKTTADYREGQVLFPDTNFWANLKLEKPGDEVLEIQNTGPTISGTNPFKPIKNNQTYVPQLSQGWIVDNPADSTEANIFFPGSPRSNVSSYYLTKDKVWTLGVDETRNKFNGATIVKKEIVIDGTEDAINQASVKLEEDTFEINEGNATIICDPRIVSGMILSFENVSKKYSGKYYVLEVKETSDSRGYIMEIVISRNAEGRIENSPANVAPAKNEGVKVNGNSQETSKTKDEPQAQEVLFQPSTKPKK